MKCLSDVTVVYFHLLAAVLVALEESFYTALEGLETEIIVCVTLPGELAETNISVPFTTTDVTTTSNGSKEQFSLVCELSHIILNYKI